MIAEIKIPPSPSSSISPFLLHQSFFAIFLQSHHFFSLSFRHICLIFLSFVHFHRSNPFLSLFVHLCVGRGSEGECLKEIHEGMNNGLQVCSSLVTFLPAVSLFLSLSICRALPLNSLSHNNPLLPPKFVPRSLETFWTKRQQVKIRKQNFCQRLFMEVNYRIARWCRCESCGHSDLWKSE